MNKQLKFEGYTINKIKVGKMFSGCICEPCEPMYNQIDVSFCNPERYKECSLYKKCERCRPVSECGKKEFLGVSFYKGLPRGYLKRIEKRLKEIYKGCRKISVSVEEV